MFLLCSLLFAFCCFCRAADFVAWFVCFVLRCVGFIVVDFFRVRYLLLLTSNVTCVLFSVVFIVLLCCCVLCFVALCLIDVVVMCFCFLRFCWFVVFCVLCSAGLVLLVRLLFLVSAICCCLLLFVVV